MGRIQWSESFSIFDDELDQHHQQLIRYIQALEARDRSTDADPAFVRMIVDGLARYAAYHFAAEEQRMREMGYPRLAVHHAEHTEFAKDVAIFAEDFGRGSERMDRVLIDYLKDWLITHILNSDKQFGEWARARRAGAKSPPGGAA